MRKLMMVGLLMLGACQFIPGTDQAKIAAAEKVASATLKDPASAQFRNARANGEYVCSEMNGKNSFGAYAGFSRVVVKGPDATVEPTGSSDEDALAKRYFEIIWSASCDIKY